MWQSQDVTYDTITIDAASTSSHDAKNTDGWDTYRSDNVTIRNSVINNGDDCVSFKPSMCTPSAKQVSVLIKLRLDQHSRGEP